MSLKGKAASLFGRAAYSGTGAFAVWLNSHQFVPRDWTMRRPYRRPCGELGEPYFISWNWDAEAPEDPAQLLFGFNNYTYVTAAQFALSMYEHVATGSRSISDARQRFFAHANFLRESLPPDGSYVFAYPLAAYGLKPGWHSSMAQGEAVSVFLRAYALTNDSSYVDAAKLAIQPLKRDVQNGGVSYIHGNDVFFEEAASDNPVHILNGHLFTAFGLWELLHHGFGDKELLELHSASVDTLRRWISRYEFRGFSLYALARDRDRRPHIATLSYHQFHIAQLSVFAAMTGETLFEQYSQHWCDGLADRRVRAMYTAQSMLRMWYGLRRKLLGVPRRWEPLPL